MLPGPITSFYQRLTSAVRFQSAPPPSARTSSSQESFTRLQALTRPTQNANPFGQASLLGCVPLLGMDWGTFGLIVAGAGIATLLFQRLHAVWDMKARPFGSLTDINLLVLNWAVLDENDAQAMSARIGALFIQRLRETINEYDQSHFQIPYNIHPNEWHSIDEMRQALIVPYVRAQLRLFQDFAQGMAIITQRDFGDIFVKNFDDFSHKIFLVAGPMTRIEDPPSREDLHNFEAFQTTLRREIHELESRLRLAGVRST